MAEGSSAADSVTDVTDVTDVRKKEVRQRIRKGGCNGCNGCQFDVRRKKEEGRTLSKNIGDVETHFSFFIPSFLFPLSSKTKPFFLHFPISDLMNSKSIQNGCDLEFR